MELDFWCSLRDSRLGSEGASFFSLSSSSVNRIHEKYRFSFFFVRLSLSLSLSFSLCLSLSFPLLGGASALDRKRVGMGEGGTVRWSSLD